MPTGLKQASSVVSIGFIAEETAANTFIQNSVDLNLSPLDREVFVVLAVNLDPASPDSLAATDTSVQTSLTTTSQTAVVGLDNPKVAFQGLGIETPPATLEYIGIIATNDFFIQCKGTNNTRAKSLRGKLYGYRAVANADIYAALVQSEVLSA